MGLVLFLFVPNDRFKARNTYGADISPSPATESKFKGIRGSRLWNPQQNLIDHSLSLKYQSRKTGHRYGDGSIGRKEIRRISFPKVYRITRKRHLTKVIKVLGGFLLRFLRCALGNLRRKSDENQQKTTNNRLYYVS